MCIEVKVEAVVEADVISAMAEKAGLVGMTPFQRRRWLKRVIGRVLKAVVSNSDTTLLGMARREIRRLSGE